MKTTLAYDKSAKQFKTQMHGRKFYLGKDAVEAEKRKTALYQFVDSQNPPFIWHAENLQLAKCIAYGVAIKLDGFTPAAAEYIREVNQGTGLTFEPTAHQILVDKVKRLEAELARYAGPMVAVRDDITLHQVIDAWHQYRAASLTIIGTTRNEFNLCQFLKRQIDPTTRLSEMDYARLDTLAKSIAKRPNSLKSGQPVSVNWAREALKKLRALLKWASKTYGYRLPELWVEAASGIVKTNKADKLKRLALVRKTYTNEELKTIYQYALPLERAIVLLGINCGFRQSEISSLSAEEIVDGKIKRYRDKSGIYSEWVLWPETAASLPHLKQIKGSKITRAWQRLVARIQKDQPDFRLFSFKQLCKTGAKAIRRLASGEVASMYLSHGSRTDDDLLEVYADSDYAKLDAALMQWRGELDLAGVSTTSQRTVVPLSKIDRCKALWASGAPVKEIMQATGFSRATAYRHRPVMAI